MLVSGTETLNAFTSTISASGRRQSNGSGRRRGEGEGWDRVEAGSRLGLGLVCLGEYQPKDVDEVGGHEEPLPQCVLVHGLDDKDVKDVKVGVLSYIRIDHLISSVIYQDRPPNIICHISG